MTLNLDVETVSFISQYKIFVQARRLIPKSPRWHISQGRVAEAEEIVLKAARVNKV